MTADADGKFSGKRLAILGCGYVGTEVARQAVAQRMKVTALTRNPAKAAVLRAEGVECVVADLADRDWHTTIAAGAELVLNCVSSGGGGFESYERSYLRGMESVLAWARTHAGAATLVYTSSTSVYPQGGGAIVDESAALDRGEGRAKVLVETEELLATAPRWFALRLAGIYGPGRSHLVEQVRAGEIAGRGEHRLNLAHRDDIVTAIWAAFGAGRETAGGVFNVADDGPAPKSEVAAWLATRLGVPPPRFTGEPATGRRRVTPDRVIANGKIKAVLGWRPQYPTFREGYEKILSH
jgi:nucleoside-diphosphate-sugar epimerase